MSYSCKVYRTKQLNKTVSTKKILFTHNIIRNIFPFLVQKRVSK